MNQIDDYTRETIIESTDITRDFLDQQQELFKEFLHESAVYLDGLPQDDFPSAHAAIVRARNWCKNAIDELNHVSEVNEEFRASADKHTKDTNASEDSIDDVIAGVTEELKSRMVGMGPGDRLVLVVGLPEEAPKSPADSLEEMLKQVFSTKLH